jgi:hypothetical protein
MVISAGCCRKSRLKPASSVGTRYDEHFAFEG